MTGQEAFEHQLQCNLQALRHLPPGTLLPQPPDTEERQLLADLVRLPEEADPLAWLRQERGVLSARLTLCAILDLLRIMTRPPFTVQYPALPADEQAVLRDLTRLLDESDNGRVVGVLRAIVDRLHTLPELPAYLASARPIAADLAQRLLVDLITLPAAADPLAWLQVERTHITARIAFAKVLMQGLPEPPLTIARPRVYAYPTYVRRTDRFQAMVYEVAFGDEGFAVRISAHLAMPDVPSWPPQSPPAWVGFDRVVDDQGYRYVMRFTAMEAGSAEWCGDPLPVVFHRAAFEKLRLACYPAVSDRVKELTFTSEGVVSYNAIGPERGPARELSPLPDVDIAPFAWRLVVPR